MPIGSSCHDHAYRSGRDHMTMPLVAVMTMPRTISLPSNIFLEAVVILGAVRVSEHTPIAMIGDAELEAHYSLVTHAIKCSVEDEGEPLQFISSVVFPTILQYYQRLRLPLRIQSQVQLLVIGFITCAIEHERVNYRKKKNI